MWLIVLVAVLDVGLSASARFSFLGRRTEYNKHGAFDRTISEYYISFQTANWTTGVQDCGNANFGSNAHLVSIESQDENDFITSKIEDQGYSAAPYWTAALYDDSRKAWLWASENEEIRWTNWKKSNPDAQPHRGMRIAFSQRDKLEYGWIKVPESQQLRFLCESKTPVSHDCSEYSSSKYHKSEINTEYVCLDEGTALQCPLGISAGYYPNCRNCRAYVFCNCKGIKTAYACQHGYYFDTSSHKCSANPVKTCATHSACNCDYVSIAPRDGTHSCKTDRRNCSGLRECPPLKTGWERMYENSKYVYEILTNETLARKSSLADVENECKLMGLELMMVVSSVDFQSIQGWYQNICKKAPLHWIATAGIYKDGNWRGKEGVNDTPYVSFNPPQPDNRFGIEDRVELKFPDVTGISETECFLGANDVPSVFVRSFVYTCMYPEDTHCYQHSTEDDSLYLSLGSTSNYEFWITRHPVTHKMALDGCANGKLFVDNPDIFLKLGTNLGQLVDVHFRSKRFHHYSPLFASPTDTNPGIRYALNVPRGTPYIPKIELNYRTRRHQTPAFGLCYRDCKIDTTNPEVNLIKGTIDIFTATKYYVYADSGQRYRLKLQPRIYDSGNTRIWLLVEDTDASRECDKCSQFEFFNTRNGTNLFLTATCGADINDTRAVVMPESLGCSAGDEGRMEAHIGALGSDGLQCLSTGNSASIYCQNNVMLNLELNQNVECVNFGYNSFTSTGGRTISKHMYAPSGTAKNVQFLQTFDFSIPAFCFHLNKVCDCAENGKI